MHRRKPRLVAKQCVGIARLQPEDHSDTGAPIVPALHQSERVVRQQKQQCYAHCRAQCSFVVSANALKPKPRLFGLSCYTSTTNTTIHCASMHPSGGKPGPMSSHRTRHPSAPAGTASVDNDHGTAVSPTMRPIVLVDDDDIHYEQAVHDIVRLRRVHGESLWLCGDMNRCILIGEAGASPPQPTLCWGRIFLFLTSRGTCWSCFVFRLCV